jgi:hypothetical protein
VEHTQVAAPDGASSITFWEANLIFTRLVDASKIAGKSELAATAFAFNTSATAAPAGVVVSND